MVGLSEAGEMKEFFVTNDSQTDKAPPKTPYTIWMEPQALHVVENLSKKQVRLLRVELKQ